MNSRLDLKYSHTIGLVAMEGRGFSNPVDLSIASDGLIYVVSRTNPLQPYGIRVGICNLDSDYIGDFGSFGSGDGQFIWPTALAFDSDDRLYMADEYNHRITVFDRAGNFLSSWGAQGDASGQFNGPSGIACDAEDNLYVVDHLNNRVQKFTTQGRHLLEWGTEGGADGYFNLPWGVTVDSVGNVYVADWRNDRIQKFSQDGKFLAKFGSSGQADGQFNRPSSVAVDADGYMYVADWGNERVQVLGPDGSFQLRLRGQATLSRWAEEFFAANPDEKQARDRSNLVPDLTEEADTPHEESARIERYFWGPTSVKLDREGRLYVTETNRHRIQIYNPIPNKPGVSADRA